MNKELERLRKLRSERYAQMHYNRALWGCFLWLTVCILSSIWLLLSLVDKGLVFFWGLLVIPASIWCMVYLNQEQEYWKNSID